MKRKAAFPVCLVVFLVLMSFCPFLVMPVQATAETRYMRSNIWTINTRTGYALNTTQTASIESLPIYSEAGDVYRTIRLGISVGRDLSNGTEIPISTPVVAIASSSTTGLLSATWSCPYTDLDSTDSIDVYVWADRNNPPTTVICSFLTEQLGANNLTASTWTVYYYLSRVFEDSPRGSRLYRETS